jgi:primosomal protein N' (replication factor Y) (superfamily II helicase)
MKFYEVAVAAPLPGPLTYCHAKSLPVGCRVRVPLGSRLSVGTVLAELPEGEGGFLGQIKQIAGILDQEPLFPPTLIPFFRWMADYYHHPLGEVIRTALPAGLFSAHGGRTAAKTKIEIVVRLCSPNPEQPAAKLKPSELKTLDLFCQHSGGSPILPRHVLTKLYAGAGKALRGLAEAGLVRLEERQVLRDPFGDALPFFARPENLTEEQDIAVAALCNAVDADTFQPFLLHGVTGSGKTEVYLRATEHCLAKGKNVLVLVPELALASQLEAHFYSRFGSKLAVLHSGLSEGERFDQWQRVLHGGAKVVVGARSAIFAPFAELGLLIVDEEHEPAYKQDDGLRYNGRDMAVLRARFASCPVLLGSATPSVTSFYHAQQGRYKLLTMSKRIDGQLLPKVEIVDLSKEKRPKQDWFFSERLTAALRDNLAQGLQSLLFVNRRGYASFMLCRDCKAVVRCRNCRVSLTLHRGSGKLICHYCGYSLKPVATCPECGSSAVAGLGLGSERVEEEVRRLFPEARVARLDSDTAGNRKNYLTLLQKVREQQIDILVGTQMVAKGLHFPNMTLVGVVWADSGLALPDCKAAERSFQLLAQVTGRAGRGEHPGRVIIQTHQPQHYVLAAARDHAYKTMSNLELELRQALGYPPFGRLINIRFSSQNEAQVERTAQAAADLLQAALEANKLEAEILGPAPAPLSLIRNRFRWQLLLKGGRPEQLHQLCEVLLKEKKRLCGTTVRLGIDVDPENMM